MKAMEIDFTLGVSTLRMDIGNQQGYNPNKLHIRRSEINWKWEGSLDFELE